MPEELITIITPAQCRAARALLGMNQGDLAKLSGVGTKTIADFEREAGRVLSSRTLTAIRQAFEKQGVQILGNSGVRALPDPFLRKAYQMAPSLIPDIYMHTLNAVAGDYAFDFMAVTTDGKRVIVQVLKAGKHNPGQISRALEKKFAERCIVISEEEIPMGQLLQGVEYWRLMPGDLFQRYA